MYTFNIREQYNDTIETYYAELKKLAKSCEFGDNKFINKIPNDHICTYRYEG